MDRLQVTDQFVEARGWAGTAAPQNPVVAIRILVDGMEIYKGGFETQQRPDVARAKGNPEWLQSGWSIKAPLQAPLSEGKKKITASALLKNGDRFDLRVPNETLIVQPVPVRSVDSSGSSIFTKIAWLAGLLLAAVAGIAAYRRYYPQRGSSPSEMLTSPLPRAPDWPALFVLAGVFFSILASKLFLIANFGSSIPFWDQWDGEAMNLLIPYMQGQLAWGDLFAPHNEHRIALTRLLVLALFQINGQWNPVVSMVAQAALHAGILTLLVGTLRQVLSNRGWVLFALLTTAVYLFPFSWKNTLWGFQSQFYFVLLCGTLGIWLTWRYEEFSRNWWIGWVFLLLGLFGMGNGILAAAAVFGVGFVRVLFAKPRPGRALFGMAALLGLIVLGATLLVEHPGHEPLKAHNISEFLSFFFKLAAWPTEIPATGLLHLPILAIGVFVLVRRPPREDSSWFLATLGAWSTLAMAALAYGRANSALDSRYTDSLAFGLLISLTSAIYLAGLARPSGLQLAMRIGIALGVAVAAGGLLQMLSRDLLVDIPAHKVLERNQKNHLLAFLSSGETGVLENKPHLHVPYPNAQRLAQILNNKHLQQILPASIQTGIASVKSSFSESAFVPNGGTYRSTPLNPKPHFGSYSKSGDSTTGELRMVFATPPNSYGLILPIAGYPRGDGMSIAVETQSGKEIPVTVQDNPKETWQEVVIKNPGEPFSIVAVDGSPKTWLAIGFPVPVGRLSLWVGWILNHWWIFGAVGVGCFVGSTLITGSKYMRYEDAC